MSSSRDDHPHTVEFRLTFEPDGDAQAAAEGWQRLLDRLGEATDASLMLGMPSISTDGAELVLRWVSIRSDGPLGAQVQAAAVLERLLPLLPAASFTRLTSVAEADCD